MCLLDDGRVFSWGQAEFGALGHGKMKDQAGQPRLVEAISEADATCIACGTFHSMVATAEGQLWAFGWGEFGQLGIGSRTSQALPQRIERIGGKKVRTVACGYFHSMAICVNYKPPPKMTKEQLRDMYNKEMDQMKKDKKKGADKGSRSKRGGNTRAGAADRRENMRASQRASMQARKARTQARTAGGASRASGSQSQSIQFKDWKPSWTPKPEDEVRSCYTWGDGEHGQLGHGDAYTSEYCKRTIKGGPAIQQQAKMRELTTLTTPRMVEALYGLRVVAMSAKGQHSMCVTEKGEMYTWGCGAFGRLGHGTEENTTVPTVVEALAKERIISISAGQHHSAAISSRNEVFTWGKGEMGALGQGEANMEPCLVPRRIGLLSRRGCCRVECSASATIVCTERGTVYSWGYNQGGRLGLGDDNVDDKVVAPMLMRHLDGAEIRQICVGEAHNLALTDYYCSDQVPERVDQGGASLSDQFVTQANTKSGCCVVM